MMDALQTLANQGAIRPLDYQFARMIHTLEPDPVLTLVSALVSYELGQGNVCLSLTSTLTQQAEPRLFDLDAPASQTLIQTSGTLFNQWPDHLQALSVTGESTVGKGSEPTPLVYDNQRLYLYRYWRYERKVADFLRNSLEKSRRISMDLSHTAQPLNQLFQRDLDFLFQRTRGKTGESLKQELIKWLDIENIHELNWSALLPLVEQAEQPDQLAPVNRLVPDSHCLNWQKVAVALAATQSFSVISGGPGTGKTTTVTRLLALLVQLAMVQKSSPNIKLVAPTGKAAARLTESIGGALNQLGCPEEVKQQIPTQAGTLHRLLGVVPGGAGFVHHRNNPLHLDILVVDEASMIDLPMMSHLLDALPDHARLILLGDRDQLASVEAGSVLGDICASANQGYSARQTDTLELLTGYALTPFKASNPQSKTITADHLCLLRKSYRFDARSGIGCLAQAINKGSPGQISRVLDSDFDDIALHPLSGSPSEEQYQALIRLCVEGYREYLGLIRKQQGKQQGKQQASPFDILAAFQRFQLLCALRQGPYGVEGLNSAIHQALQQVGLISGNHLWYEGRPVLITRNDHGLGLYNGDIGIALRSPDGRLRVAFELPDHSIRLLLPSRLPEHETVFAMTIHKSQGSEFHHVAMVLPDQFSPIITRELVYTGITRAREKLDLFCEQKMMAIAARNPTRRESGLYQQLMSKH